MQDKLTTYLLGQPTVILLLILAVIASNALWYRYHIKLVNFWVSVAKYLIDVIVSFVKDSTDVKSSLLEKIEAIKKKVDEFEEKK